MENDDIANMPFNQIAIGDNNYNINRTIDDNFVTLSDFSDAVPHFDSDIGPHMVIKMKDGKTVKKIPIPKPIMLIENANQMEAEEYYRVLIEKKKEFVTNNLIKQTYAMGYENPSAVQHLGIIELTLRKDALIQSKSGTGKTHLFLFGCLWHFDPADSALQHVIITSSHEVAIQTYDKACKLLPPSTKIALCIGQKKDTTATSTGSFKTPVGTSTLNIKYKSLREEKEDAQSAQVIVCTMGKFYDILCNKKWISLDYLKSICVDEFDNIVASRSKSRSSAIMSTEDQMAAIMNAISDVSKRQKSVSAVQRVFCSATVSEDSLKIACSYFRPFNTNVGEPFIALLDVEDYTLEGIRQYYVQVEKYEQKLDVLLDLIKQCRISQAIVFTNRVDTAESIKHFLDNESVPIASAVFHGNLPSAVRANIHKDMIENKIRLLISTDVTARGLDIHSINLVIIFDMPDNLDSYIHRIGRSGRFGRKGVAISLILVNSRTDERKKLEAINECSKNSKVEEINVALENLL